MILLPNLLSSFIQVSRESITNAAIAAEERGISAVWTESPQPQGFSFPSTIAASHPLFSVPDA